MYKRQELSRNTLLPLWQQRASFLSEKQNNQNLIEFDLTEINRIDSAGFALLCDFLHDCEPVSYTHLDVYKRQV